MPTEITAAVARVAITARGCVHIISAEDGETILEAGLRAGMDLPWACGVGVCGTCSARLIEGSVSLAASVGGCPPQIVRTCQAVPIGSGVSVDYDAA